MISTDQDLESILFLGPKPGPMTRLTSTHPNAEFHDFLLIPANVLRRLFGRCRDYFVSVFGLGSIDFAIKKIIS